MNATSLFASDKHSFAQPQVALVTHLDLNLAVDFEEKLITGIATYTIQKKSNADDILFDTSNLIINKVELNAETEASFSLGPEQPFLGRPLIIKITPTTEKVTIYYQTSPQATALQWLNPAQTGGKIYPFLFTQSQAILARSWLPCQDSPGIRFTYRATVQVPTQFVALMSADNPIVKNKNGEYSFTQNNPIPSYLMALAVGDLVYEALDNRTGIYAEPQQLAPAVKEFAELPAMLKTAEAIYGNYKWNRYDLLLLPPSFPFGGMENPQLTFVTPTIIAGDQSLTSLVAHELAHSWSGNLVTNATWNDFWLNEGFTVYFERRIMEALHGKDYADMLKVLGITDLEHTLQELGYTSPDTHLKLNLDGRNPDEGLTEIAYEKGNYFLLALEEAYGRTAFDNFVRKYFSDHAFRAMNTKNFLLYLKENLLNLPTVNPVLKVNPEEWLYQPGLPAAKPTLQSELFNKVIAAVNIWEENQDTANLPTQNWSTHEWLFFLHQIELTLTKAKMQDLDRHFNLTHSGNAEIQTIWFQQAIQLSYEPAYAVLEEFLNRVGRRKFLVPLYKALQQHNNNWAKQIYARARPNYHAVATSTLDDLLHYKV